MIFIFLVGLFVLVAYLMADHKRTKEIANEKPGDRYIRKAAGSWKIGSPPMRFKALTAMGIEPNYASTMVNLKWEQVPVQAQIALANFQATIEIDPGSLTIH